MSSLFEKLGANILARMFEVAAHGLALTDESGRFLHINARGCAILGRPYDEVLQRRFLEAVAERDKELAEGWFSGSLKGQIGLQDFAFAQPGGKEREVSSFAVPVALENQRAALIALHDVTESRRAEREARTLARIVSSLTLKTSVRAIAETVAEWVVETTEASASALVLAGDDPGYGHVMGSFGQAADEERVEAVLRAQGLLEGGGPLALELRDAPWGSLQSVPLHYRGERIGLLVSLYPPGHLPDQGDRDFLQAIADQSVFATLNARLFTDAQDKAALEERQRLARELHDSVSQALYGIALGARSARSQLATNPERVGERLDYVLKLAEAGITEMRALIFELRPETLAAEGLVTALDKQAAALRARHHLMVEVDMQDEPELSLSAKEALYRIAQEALHNIVKHARATRVTLALRLEDKRTVLEISDDGIGFDPSGSFPGHLGLKSMRERAELMGGALRIVSVPGSGTRLRATLPMSQPRPPAA